MNANHYNHRFSIVSEGDQTMDSTVQYLSASCIARWVERSPSAQAVMTLDGGDTVNLPIYALRRRNAVVANLPDAPFQRITA
ncbi:hypothetical protein BDB01DRAFT_774476 [Pilobolus umbonatus]|nr:hypothetical protein BDB01DRAFT_774476 [Pilobolus umbonatus]